MKPACLSSLAIVLGVFLAPPALAQSTPPPLPADPAPAGDAPEEPAAPPPSRAPEGAAPPAVTVESSYAASVDQPAPEGSPRYDLVRVNLGLKVGYLPSRAFDSFAASDTLPQLSIDGTYPVLTRGKVVLGVGLGWDVGGRSDTVRGLQSSLTTHRLYVPIEGRYHLTPGLFAFGKISPGAAAALSSVEDPSSPRELSGTGWAFAADASVGASILMGPRARMDKRTARFWLTPEIGYAVTTAAPLRVNPGRAEGDLLGADENTNLRSLAMSGLFWRASLGATF